MMRDPCISHSFIFIFFFIIINFHSSCCHSCNDCESFHIITPEILFPTWKSVLLLMFKKTLKTFKCQFPLTNNNGDTSMTQWWGCIPTRIRLIYTRLQFPFLISAAQFLITWNFKNYCGGWGFIRGLVLPFKMPLDNIWTVSSSSRRRPAQRLWFGREQVVLGQFLQRRSFSIKQRIKRRPILYSLAPRAAKAWLAFRRRSKRKIDKEASRIERLNLQLFQRNQCIVEENERLRKQALLLTEENQLLQQKLQEQLRCPDKVLGA